MKGEGSDYEMVLTWEEAKAAGGDGSFEEWKNRMLKNKKPQERKGRRK